MTVTLVVIGYGLIGIGVGLGVEEDGWRAAALGLLWLPLALIAVGAAIARRF